MASHLHQVAAFQLMLSMELSETFEAHAFVVAPTHAVWLTLVQRTYAFGSSELCPAASHDVSCALLLQREPGQSAPLRGVAQHHGEHCCLGSAFLQANAHADCQSWAV